jgi:hypothetical protein
LGESYNKVTVTFTVVVCVTPPLIADMVTVYVPGVVSSDVETVSVTVLVPPAERAAFDELRDTVGFESEKPTIPLAAVTDAWSPRVPAKPLMLVSVIVD